MINDKILGQGLPHVAGFAIAVQQNHGWACAADADMDRGAVGCDLLCPDFGWELDLGGRWKCDGCGSQRTDYEPEHLSSPIEGRGLAAIAVGASPLEAEIAFWHLPD
jgi:hypothetical protein